MKNKGFTLIELLGVIIILGILVLIAFPPLLNQIRNSKNEIKNSTKTLIIDAAKDYYEDNIANYETIEGMTYCINISTLTENNYLNEKLKDENLNNIDTTKKVKLVYHNSKFDYEIIDTCNNNVLTRNNIEVPIVTEDSGLYKSQTDTDRFIYRGGNPNNYIWLDENGDGNKTSEELYRIISYENDGTIKVMRNEKIDSMYWDNPENRTQDNGNSYCKSTSDGCNAWSNTANTKLNEKLSNDMNIIDKNTLIYNGETVKDESSLNVYLNNTWYDSLQFKNKIQIHSYNIGGIIYNEPTLEKEKYEESLIVWNGKIGLINATEYVESSTNPGCTSTWSNTDKNSNVVKQNNYYPCSVLDENMNPLDNWMIKSDRFWTISSNISPNQSQYVWIIFQPESSDERYKGVMGNNSAARKRDIYPAFYLKSDVMLTGEGSEENPYRLADES